MVKLKQHAYLLPDSSINIQAWLQHIGTHYSPSELSLIREASVLTQLAGTHYLQQGVAMAEILIDLNMDSETIAACLIYNCVHDNDLSLEDVTEHLGSHVTKLVQNVMRMDAIRQIYAQPSRQHSQIENIRKMLLAMAEDLRVVLIKLAERTYLLRNANQIDNEHCQQIAREARDIYAPLANRLGVSQIKWELEDLAFRYLEPDAYKKLATSLAERRLDRENYINQVILELKKCMAEAGLEKVEIMGRAKHLYSIYRKMQRKDVDHNKIYDISAVRVLANTIEDCYVILSVVQSRWQQIPEEFDDYISTPKDNGYRSIHTAVIGPQGKNLEVQIRTYEMHKESELGVAAHWRYKEGKRFESSYENKIAWLRQVLEWQKEVSGENDGLDKTKTSFLQDRVYVFTPDGDIIDLMKGSTPLDFAYHIHSQVGHRCRGAKVNGHIVPLTYELAMGDRVEILTTREPSPSRDWLNPHLGYLKSSRAKAKILHWFKEQDFDRNLEEGKELFERELRKLEVGNVNHETLAEKLHYRSSHEMFAALGRGDLRFSQLLNLLHPVSEHPQKPHDVAITTQARQLVKKPAKGVYIHGVGNLITHTAKCCKPLPGDDILGFITLGHGVSIHRSDCLNILQAQKEKEGRLIEVSWSSEPSNVYPVDISITAYDRQGLVRDITTIVTSEKLNLVAFTTRVDKSHHTAYMTLTLEISGLPVLSKIIDKIHQLPNIIDVKREI